MKPLFKFAYLFFVKNIALCHVLINAYFNIRNPAENAELHAFLSSKESVKQS